MIDFLQPGEDGQIEADVNQWLRGIVYTARPGIPSLVQPGHEYRITVAFKQKIAVCGAFTGFQHLYQRVTAIAEVRISQLTCTTDGKHNLHTWILLHGWRSHETYNIAAAFLTIGLACIKERDEKPKGMSPPTAGELMTPGGATLEILGKAAPQRADEVYNEFDFSTLAQSSQPFIVSYGESVPTCEGIDFEPFANRAADFTHFYHGLLHSGVLLGAKPPRIIRRKWYCVTDPNLVTFEVLFL